MMFAIRKLGSPYWKYDLWGWLLMGHATEGMQAVGQILISHTTAPEDQAAAMGESTKICYSRLPAVKLYHYD